ncbi:MAG: transposase [Longimicrobiales bacterium]
MSEVRRPLPATPRRPARFDDEYRRGGTYHLLLFFQPLAGWRHIEVTEGYTARDFAQCIKALVDSYFPKAALTSVILDNVNTHTPAALYETFPPAVAPWLPKGWIGGCQLWTSSVRKWGRGKPTVMLRKPPSNGN